ncbi:phosphoglycerate kinase [Candidatus Woesearchaeota archaeon]|nr:phosphoglycerate kinase [Candidatus Woesearchaeota archaeon]
MKLKQLTPEVVKNKTVILRTGFDVPLEHKKILDDSRIKDALPTINFLLENNCKIIILTHLHRPEGKVVEALRLDPIAKRLEELTKTKVKKLNYIVGAETEIRKLQQKEILMLENIRFLPEEEDNDEVKRDRLAKLLGHYGQLYINEAFSDCHRSHASITSLPKFLPAYPGFSLKHEVETIQKILKKAQKPFVLILGGAKLKTKIPLIEHLLPKVSKILLGGAMIFTFYAAKEINTGKSLVEYDEIEEATKIMKKAKGKLVLPVDIIAATKIDKYAKTMEVHYNKMPSSMIGVDIGHVTISHYKQYIKQAKTILWNGPLGIYEIKKFRQGTEDLANYLAQLKATKIIGGGDTGDIIHDLKLEDKMTFVATGGGASLALFSGKILPGLKPLSD